MDLITADPGTHFVVFGKPSTAIEARRQGLQVRDTFLIQSPSRCRLAFLLRKPLDESTVAAQIVKTGTGAMNIDGCRVASRAVDGRWPTNLLFVHGPACRRQNQTMNAWFCDGSCPVAELDAQSGILKSGRFSPVVRSNRGGWSGKTPPVSTYSTEGDSGGASRFYPQFANDPELIEWLTKLVAPHGIVITDNP